LFSDHSSPIPFSLDVSPPRHPKPPRLEFLEIPQEYQTRQDGRLGNAHDYRQAIALNPENPISQYFLAWSLWHERHYAEAIHHFGEALRIDSNLDDEVYVFYAWLLATCPEEQLRNPAEAIRLMSIPCDFKDWNEDQPLGVLAAAHAANGDFDQAVKWQTKALEIAYEDRKDLQNERLELYRAGRPYVGTDEP